MSAPAPERGRADRGAAADHLPVDAQARRLHALTRHHELPRPDRERQRRDGGPTRSQYVLRAVPRCAAGLPEVPDRGGQVHAAWVSGGSIARVVVYRLPRAWRFLAPPWRAAPRHRPAGAVRFARSDPVPTGQIWRLREERQRSTCAGFPVAESRAEPPQRGGCSGLCVWSTVGINLWRWPGSRTGRGIELAGGGCGGRRGGGVRAVRRGAPARAAADGVAADRRLGAGRGPGADGAGAVVAAVGADPAAR